MKNIFFLLLVVCLYFLGCHKDETCKEIEHLVDLQETSLFQTVYPSYGVPYFNPNNSEEIIFFYANEESGTTEKLVKYNLISKEYYTIHEGNIGIRPRWSKKGWIIFQLWNELGNDGYNIWKIKENGDSLTQLTTSGLCFFPEWNKEGDKFIYELGYTSPTKFIIADQNGDVIDTTLVGVGGNGSWQHDSLVANGNFQGLFIGNPYSNFYDYDLIYSLEHISQSAGGAEWINEHEIIWSHVTGVYFTNISDSITHRILKTCNAKFYQLPTYSPQLNKVIFQRVERIITDGEKGDLYSELYMMNLDGTDEEKIEILE
ncbi:MAG: hypothetical protein KDC85_18525 [Saprospiraceae bacterium]|nr:hypothetical protein [Saprospiraceae bacterium]MCB9323377.1 hypothetical protein [Lewinellaceae bacterium]